MLLVEKYGKKKMSPLQSFATCYFFISYQNVGPLGLKVIRV
jgi:hypothetical protein